jgi:hypothetical protein
MPSGRSYSWRTHQSDGPVIIEREPNVRTRRPARPHQKPKTLIFGFKFVNPFTSKKPSVPVVRQQICRRPRGPDRVEVVEVREPTREPGGSREPTPMSRGGRHEDFVPLPPRIPIPRHDPDPIIEIVTPRERERPEIHQPRRHSFDFPMDRSPVRIPEPDRIAHERDLRRQASHQAKLKTRRRKEAERETIRARQAAARDAERLREVNDFAEHFRRMAINERENRREAESEARRLAVEKREAEEIARQAEYAVELVRQLTEMAILRRG